MVNSDRAKMLIVVIDGKHDDVSYVNFVKNMITEDSDVLVVRNPGDHWHEPIDITAMVRSISHQYEEWTSGDSRVLVSGVPKWPRSVPSRLFIEPSMTHGNN